MVSVFLSLKSIGGFVSAFGRHVNSSTESDNNLETKKGGIAVSLDILHENWKSGQSLYLPPSVKICKFNEL